MKNNRIIISTLILVVATGIMLAGCGNGSNGSDDDDTELRFRVTITNLTANQPLSPVAIVLHDDGYEPWDDGDSASVGLEQLAEGGDASQFIASADADQDVMDTATGTAPVGPGAIDMFEVTTEDDSGILLSIATMLVNTNDGFAGINSHNIDNFAVGESQTVYANAMDAGTEGNTEALSDIPGPAAGGEGFNATRDDQDVVTGHPGVVTVDDGLSTSILDESHRWDNPVAKITVMRLE